MSELQGSRRGEEAGKAAGARRQVRRPRRAARRRGSQPEGKASQSGHGTDEDVTMRLSQFQQRNGQRHWSGREGRASAHRPPLGQRSAGDAGGVRTGEGQFQRLGERSGRGAGGDSSRTLLREHGGGWKARLSRGAWRGRRLSPSGRWSQRLGAQAQAGSRQGSLWGWEAPGFR